jgi:predicted nucleic acid-binding protein
MEFYVIERLGHRLFADPAFHHFYAVLIAHDARFLGTGFCVRMRKIMKQLRDEKNPAVYELTHVEIVTAVEMLLHHPDLTLQDADSVAAALEQYRKRPALGFSDCLILETARKAGHIPLGTFDRNLSKQDGAEGL